MTLLSDLVQRPTTTDRLLSMWQLLSMLPASMAPSAPMTPSAPMSGSGPVALGRRLAARKYGWTGPEWDALYELWRRESGWNPTADNPTSSAYGIPQALTSVHDVGRAYLAGDPRAQILWGLRYIANRYGSPTAALAHSDRMGWY